MSVATIVRDRKFSSTAPPATRFTREEAYAKIARRFRGFGDEAAGLPAGEFFEVEGRADTGLTTSGGGNLVTDHLVRGIVQALGTHSAVFRNATVVGSDVGAKFLDVAFLDDLSNSGVLLDEHAAETTLELTFSRIALPAFKYSSQQVVASVELADDSPQLFVANMQDALARRIARATNPHFTTGDGSGKPRGLVTDAGNSSVVCAGASPTASEMLALKHSVDPAYWASASFMAHPDTLLAFKQNLIASNAASLLGSGTFDGHPLVANPAMPTGSAAKAVVFGDLSKYYIRSDNNMTFRVLNQRYAEKLQTAAVLIWRLGGALVDANAVKYLTLAS